MESKNKYKVSIGATGINETTDDVIGFIVEETSKILDLEQLEKDISEMELNDAILLNGISILRIL